MSKDSQRITHSCYESAGEMLLDKIAEVNSILIKQKAKTGETESYRFWIKVADVMKFAWDYFGGGYLHQAENMIASLLGEIGVA